LFTGSGGGKDNRVKRAASGGRGMSRRKFLRFAVGQALEELKRELQNIANHG
jgi:hypothetical protein